MGENELDKELLATFARQPSVDGELFLTAVRKHLAKVQRQHRYLATGFITVCCFCILLLASWLSFFIPFLPEFLPTLPVVSNINFLTETLGMSGTSITLATAAIVLVLGLNYVDI